MASLKDLRIRISTIKSTQKITSAMKMVAVAKLKKSEEQVKAARPFSIGIGKIVTRMMKNDIEKDNILLNNLNGNRKNLLILVTSDRGLCGSFNNSLIKEARNILRSWKKSGIDFEISCLGKKGKDSLRHEFKENIIHEISGLGKSNISWDFVYNLSEEIRSIIDNNSYSNVEAIYSRFQSPLIQKVTHQSLIPYQDLEENKENSLKEKEFYFDILEPSGEELYKRILPKNFAAQIYRILLESIASEHGARMTAMDNATRNARDVINKLQLTYNRTRQALITKELIEVISGAEAL